MKSAIASGRRRITAESAIATICGSDAQDPPIFADRRNSPNRRHRGAKDSPDGPSLNLSAWVRWIRKSSSRGSGSGLASFLGRATLILAFNKGMWSGRQGRISAITDLEKADIQPCGEFLQHFAVKANLVVILRGGTLGLADCSSMCAAVD